MWARTVLDTRDRLELAADGTWSIVCSALVGGELWRDAGSWSAEGDVIMLAGGRQPEWLRRVTYRGGVVLVPLRIGDVELPEREEDWLGPPFPLWFTWHPAASR